MAAVVTAAKRELGRKVMDVLTKIPVKEQDAKKRATNFDEVCLGYTLEEAMAEASRCINCKNAHCIEGCPVSINIPAFLAKLKDGEVEAAYQIISESRKLSANEFVFEESREIRFLSESWSDLWPTGLAKKESSLKGRKRRKEKRWLLSAPGLPDLPVQEIWPEWAMRSPFLRPFMRWAVY